MKTEVDLAKKVIAWLEEEKWDVYQEVEVYGSVADIVALQGPLLWIIECKLSLSLDLIGQAIYWRRKAHLVSVAVPKTKRRFSKARTVAEMVLKQNNIGLIEVPTNDSDIYQQEIRPGLNRHAHVEDIKLFLNEKQKHWAPAGSACGGHYTKFKETCRRIARIVNRNPGIVLKDLIDKTSHHYASDAGAKASISHWAQKGKIDGIRCEKDGKKLRFYPKNDN